MENIEKRLSQDIQKLKELIPSLSEADINAKPLPEKWSKKEILGHLIDSEINNLQRFTEIQYSDKPYQIRGYDQVELVIANAYQNADTNELLGLCVALNNRILKIISQQGETTLGSEILLPNGNKQDLRFLIQDYVEHLEHHISQFN